MEHQFGGSWTEEKLERLKKYFHAYMQIFTKNEKAKFFTRIYVDAFAGTGSRSTGKKGDFTSQFEGDLVEIRDGSAKIALEMEPPFHKFVFIEKNPEFIGSLETLKAQFPNKAQNVEILQGGANSILQEWCRVTDWKKHRAIAFLDPYAMAVDWETVEMLGRTEAVDMWLLFPLGVAVNRLLPKNEKPPKPWADKLTRFLGTSAWEDEFYRKDPQLTLFSEGLTFQKRTNWEGIGKFFVNRLKTCFNGVAENPKPLYNSRNNPIYLLCFAAGNPVGAKTAVNIASHLLEN